MSQPKQRDFWGSRFAFMAAAVGSAVGLGNIWKFPYMTGQNGGGAFVLMYLLFIAIIGVPIFIAELYIGKKGQSDAVTCFKNLSPKNNVWAFAGVLGVVSAFLILSFYSVVTGWVFEFAYKSITNQFSGQSDESIKGMLDGLFSDPIRMIFWHAITMAITVGIVWGGIKGGIEKFSKILMPSLVILLFVLLLWSLSLEGFQQALVFLFSPDFSKLTASSVLSAVGHSFFTLSLGLGAMITYGSYLKPDENIVAKSVVVSLADTLIALIAGIVIFSIVFSFPSIEPSGGPGLMFVTLPLLFQKIAGGQIVAVLFFLLVVFAAITSAISLLEVVISYFLTRTNLGRKKLAVIFGSAIFALGILSALSFNVLKDVKIIKFNFFDLFDGLTTNLFMPFGGMVTALFLGWVIGERGILQILRLEKPNIWSIGLLWTLRVVAPACVAWILVSGTISWLK